MIVMKFGGTSVEDASAIRQAADIVRGRLHEQPVVVVSAMAAVTNSMLAMAGDAAAGSLPQACKVLRRLRQRHLATLRAVADESTVATAAQDMRLLFDSLQEMLRGIASLGELTPRTTDHVLSVGELLSTRLVKAAFVAQGIPAALVDSRQCIVTDATYTKAVPILQHTTNRLRDCVVPLLEQHQVAVMAGFIAATADGITTTLGRGGSDFSAALIGAALDAARIEIWTDVEGMMTTDPRMCPQAQRIDVIGFDEASELAYFGAKVLHPATLMPAVEKNIPVLILNSRRPESAGTCIRAHAPRCPTTFRAIAAKPGIKVINVKAPRMLLAHGFMRRLFEIFERHCFAADLVSTSEVSVSVALDSASDLTALLHDLRQLGEVEAEDAKAIICLVGKDIRGRSGVAASVFGVLAAYDINIHMISQGASEMNISCVVEEADVVEAVQQLHKRFFELPEPERPLGFRSPGKRLRAPTLSEQVTAQPEAR